MTSSVKAAGSTARRAAVGSFGRLWGRGHESFTPSMRRIIRVSGKGATQYLQGLVTCDLLSSPIPPQPEPSQQKQPGIPKRWQEEEEQEEIPEGQQQQQVEFNEKLHSACFLDSKGRIITDSLIWKMNEEQYYIDCPVGKSGSEETKGAGSSTSDDTYESNTTNTTMNGADMLLQHLKQYKIGRSTRHIKIEDFSNQVASHVIFGTLATQGSPPGYITALDPRHPSLGMRILQPPDDENSTLEQRHEQFTEMMSQTFPHMPDNYEFVRRLAGVAESHTEIGNKVALESNQEFLNAVSFQKGCYLGQELTARVQHTGVLRKRIMPLLLLDTQTQVPHIWNMASSIQEGRARNKFKPEELAKLPTTRLPRLSVLTAGNLVAICTGSIQPDDGGGDGDFVMDTEAQKEWDNAQSKSQELLENINVSCKVGNKITDSSTEKTIGQIVTEPMPGTNLVLALIRLDSVGLIQGKSNTDGNGSWWSKTNKVMIGSSDNDENSNIKREFRYLPYLPLWWPEIDYETGKGIEPSDDGDELESLVGFSSSGSSEPSSEPDENNDSNNEDDGTASSSSGFTRIEIEEVDPTSDEEEEKKKK